MPEIGSPSGASIKPRRDDFSPAWGGRGLGVTDMYAMTSETANTGAFCVWPSEAPYRQHNGNEAELVARLRAGDEGAFREIIARYASKISRVSYGILRNLDDADEI